MSNEHSSSKDPRTYGEILNSILGMLQTQVQDEWDHRNPDEQWLVPIFNVPEEHPSLLALEHGPSDYTMLPNEGWKPSLVRMMREFAKVLARKIKDEEIGGLRICEKALKECTDEMGFIKEDMFPAHVMHLLESGKYRQLREVAESMEVDFGRKPKSDKEQANYRNKHPFIM